MGYSKRSTHNFGFMAMTPQFDFDHFNRPQIVVIPKIWTMWFTNHTVHIICGCTFAVRYCWCSFHIKQKYWIQIELIWNYFLEITCKQQTRFNLDIRRSDQIPSWERPRIPSSTWPSTFIDILYFFARFWKIEPVLFCYFSNDKNFAKMRLAEQAEWYDEMKDYMRDVEQ